ncbi:hypothetical protein D3C80_956810 [compost metagenome]
MSLIYALNSAAGRAQVVHRDEHRRTFNAIEKRLASEGGYVANAIGDIGPKAWLEMDAEVVRLIGQEADPLLADLLPLAQSVAIGKYAVSYKQLTDMDRGETSLSGQVTHLMGSTGHQFGGVLVPTHVKAFGRQWREVEANRTIGLDELREDQEAATREVLRLMTDNFVDGNAGLNYQGFEAFGIKTNPGTKAITLTKDFSSALTSFADMDAEFTRILTTMRSGTNRVTRDLTVYISPEIEANWRRRSGPTSFDRTFLEVFRETAGVEDIKVSYRLTGNELIGFVRSREYIRPVVGQAVGTTPVPRLRPFDDFQFVTWGAAGLQILADAEGRSGVFYAA